MSERDWRLHVTDMIEFAERALSYTKGLDRSGFAGDRMTYDATIRNLSLIGEAARRIPDDVRSAHPDVPWRELIATRNN